MKASLLKRGYRNSCYLVRGSVDVEKVAVKVDGENDIRSVVQKSEVVFFCQFGSVFNSVCIHGSYSDLNVSFLIAAKAVPEILFL